MSKIYVLTSGYESFCSKDRKKILRKFVEVYLIPYFQDTNNKIENHYKPSSSTYSELQKALSGDEYDVTKMNSYHLLEVFDEYTLYEAEDLDD